MKPKKTQLPNGLTIITSGVEGTEAITALVLVKVGSRYESVNMNGAAHFIEHLMFKGTKRRPSTLEISNTLDKHGAEYNAFTSKEVTGYYIKIIKKQLPLAMDILEDVLFHSLFKAEEIERERGVIIEEINMYDDNPLISIGDLFEETLYGKNHPLGRETAGTRGTVKKMKRLDLLEFKKRHYIPSKTTVVVAGACDHETVVKLTEGHFRQRGQKRNLKFRSAGEAPRKCRVSIKTKKTAQAQIALGFKGPSYTHPARYASELLALILGGSMSSRLFIEVRERRGLAYSIHSFIDPYEDTGSIGVSAGVDPDRAEEAIRVILEELKKILKHGVSEKELKDAKSFISGKLALQIEDSAALAQWYAKKHVLEKSFETPDEYLERINKATGNEIKSAAKLFFKRPPVLSIIGPFDKKEKFEKLITR